MTTVACPVRFRIVLRRKDSVNKRSEDPVGRLSVSLASRESDCCRSRPYNEVEIIFSYYDFIAPCPLSHLPVEDVQFLERQKCFSVPIRPILDKITRVYFLHVHPHLPILNEATFWDLYTSESHELPTVDRLSLFTLQAFLCVACPVCNDKIRNPHELDGRADSGYSF